MIANHGSHLDAICLLSSLPLWRVHHAFPAAAADYFFSSPLRTMLTTTIVNGVPLDRRRGAAALDACRRLLIEPDNVVIMFPEGTRSSSGELGRFHSGVARLVVGTSTPVVPCYVTGAYEAWPRHRALPGPGRVRLHVGRPRVFRDGSPDDRQMVASVSARLRQDVVELAAAVNTGRDRSIATSAGSPSGRRQRVSARQPSDA